MALNRLEYSNKMTADERERLESLFDIEQTRNNFSLSGHNLTAVLNNPREGLFDLLWDEFEIEQNAIADYTPTTQTEIMLPSHSPSDSLRETYISYSKSHTKHFIDDFQAENLDSDSAVELDACFHTLPNYFFESDFDLTNPETFSIVSSLSAIPLKTYSRSESPDLMPITELPPLSSFLDQVEITLFDQIKAKSHQLFNGLSRLNEFSDQIASLQVQVAHHKSRLVTWHEKVIVEGTVRIALAHHKRQRYEKVRQLYDVIRARLERIKEIESFLNLFQFPEAYSSIIAVREEEMIDIDSFKRCSSLQFIETKRQNLLTRLRNSLIDRFLSCIPRDSLPSTSSDPPQLNNQDDMLRSVILDVVMSESVIDVLKAFGLRIESDIKNTILVTISSYFPVQLDGSKTRKREISLSEKISSLSIDKLEVVISECFSGCIHCLENDIGNDFVWKKVFLFLEEAYNLTSSHNENDSDEEDANQLQQTAFKPASTQVQSIHSELLLLTRNACNFCQRSIGNLIHQRQDSSGDALSMGQIRTIWMYSLEFGRLMKRFSNDLVDVSCQFDSIQQYKDNIQVICPYLSSCICSTAKRSLASLHDQNKRKLMSIMNAEKWQVSNCSRNIQFNMTEISSDVIQIDVSGLDSYYCNTGQGVVLADGLNDGVNDDGDMMSIGGMNSNSNHNNNHHNTPEMPLVIQSIEYKVAWSAIFVLDICHSYLTTAHLFDSKDDPNIPLDAAHCLCELIDLFSSRSKSLVLNSEATRPPISSLKSITARHLCVLMRSLSLMIVLLERCRFHFSAMIYASEVGSKMSEMSRVMESLQEHWSLLSQHLSAIIIDSTSRGLNKLRDFSWDNAGREEVEYFSDLAVSINKLHQIVSSCLSEDEIRFVFDNLLSSLTDKLTFLVKGMKPARTESGRNRLNEELERLCVSCEKLTSVNCLVLRNGVLELIVGSDERRA